MPLSRRLLLLTLLLAASPLSSAGNEDTTAARQKSLAPAAALPLDVSREDARRRPILDGLRRTLEPELGQPLRFLVHALREENGFAFAQVQPLDSRDRPLDWSKTQFAAAMQEGWMDGDTTYALLQLQAGQWQVIAHVIGPTDVAWADWPQRYGVSADLLGLPRQ